MTDSDYSVRVYAKIVADLFHPGHIRFLQHARSLGTHLTVCVVPDDRVHDYKGSWPVFTHEERMEIVQSCRWVDAVIGTGPKEITQQFMAENDFQIYAFGAVDDEELAAKLRDSSDLPESMTRVISYTSGISSSLLRTRVEKMLNSEN